MNEMQVLDRFRADVPAADPAVLARGRSALLATAPPRRHRFRITLPRLAIGGGLTAAVTATAVTLSLAGGGGTATAATVLAKASARAAAEPAAAHPGQYAFIETLRKTLPGTESAGHERAWWPVDGKGHFELQSASGNGRYQVEPTRVVLPCPTAYCYQPPLLEAPTYDYLSGLPTDQASLKKIVYAAAKTGPFGASAVDTQAFMLICQALTRSAAPPKVRAALLKVAAQIPGTLLERDATDAAGRHGVGVRIVLNGGDEVVLIFDRTTYRVLGENMNMRARGVVEAEAVVRTGIVDRIGELP
ncbi:MAG: CU044_5270 family protein [Mycobacteriales bacterium]